MRSLLRMTLLGLATLAAGTSVRPARACGGFFCNSAQPVNQAAEGIIFADNGDGTVTAVIQIQYQGPSENFSWLLPISSVPKQDSDIGVASNLAFQRLQSATNPQYTLTTRIEGTCRQDDFRGGAGGAASAGGVPVVDSSSSAGNGGVTVEASGVVGAFEWTVISLDQSLAEPSDVATKWLTDNGYDVPSGSANLLGPYLKDGLYLLALRLTKGSDSGSIRPIVLTYTGTKPSIPIKLTAVAANDDMGVMTWVLGESRAVPQNYLSLELNEARINWFRPGATYNAVVTEAANDAGGQGFVTEFAGQSSTLAERIWTASDAQLWTSFKTRSYSSFQELFQQAQSFYGSWDGFWDATRAVVTLPAGVSFEDFKLCPSCYLAQIQLSPAKYVAALEESVIVPVQRVQELVDAHPMLTRLYSTLSAEEMTLDPEFTFNAELAEVSNVHTATRVIECEPSLSQFQAPWRIELPQGDVIRGTGAQAQSQSWPADLASLPPNRRIVRSAESGAGKVLEDNASAITSALEDYNASVAARPFGGSGGGGAAAGGASGSSGTSAGGSGAGAAPTSDSAGTSSPEAAPEASGGGCSVGSDPAGPSGALLTAAALAAAGVRRRRRRS